MKDGPLLIRASINIYFDKIKIINPSTEKKFGELDRVGHIEESRQLRLQTD